MRTTVGKTLEDLPGIEENDVPGPAAPGVELEAVRRGSGSHTTPFIEGR